MLTDHLKFKEDFSAGIFGLELTLDPPGMSLPDRTIRFSCLSFALIVKWQIVPRCEHIYTCDGSTYIFRRRETRVTDLYLPFYAYG